MGEYLSTPNKEKASEDGIFELSSNCDVSFGLSLMQGWRRQMEDTHICDQFQISSGVSHSEENTLKSRNSKEEDLDVLVTTTNQISTTIGLFGIYDGHGGKEISAYIKLYLKEALLKSEEFRNHNYSKALADTYIHLDKSMLTQDGRDTLHNLSLKILDQEREKVIESIENNETSYGKNDLKDLEEMKSIFDPRGNPQCEVAMFMGSTACTALLASNKIYIANAGDSRAVKCVGGLAERITTDHKTLLVTEQIRIFKAEGQIENGYIDGNLCVTRSLGDHMYKSNKNLDYNDQIIIAQPDVYEIEVDEKLDYIILASDGIWDSVANDQDVVDFINSRLKSYDKKDPISKIIEELFDHLIYQDKSEELNGNSGCDNMSCIVLRMIHKKSNDNDQPDKKKQENSN